jgi:hypothetical protein
MLIHITPRLLTCELSGHHCELVDLTIAELGLHLRNGKELVSRRPYPNKRYVVACRKSGQKAIDGILIETPSPVTEFSAVSRWAIAGELVVRHRVNYAVLDNDYDAVSDSMTLWYATYSGLKSRVPDSMPDGWTPASTQPRMDLSPDTARMGAILNRTVDGLIVERTETLRMRTIERCRLLDESRAVRDRLPTLSSAFPVAAGRPLQTA